MGLRPMNRPFVSQFIRNLKERNFTKGRARKLASSTMIVDTEPGQFDFVGPFETRSEARSHIASEPGWNSKNVKMVDFTRFKSLASRAV